jgi:uncharacterized membrane protein YfcA
MAMALATFVGLSLGALGSGGSIITIPILIYVAGISAETAVGMSLVIVGTTSLLGAVLHFRNGNVALKPSLLFAVTGMAGSFLGSSGTHLVPRRVLMLMFSGIMLIVARVMWRGASGLKPGAALSIHRSLIAGFAVGLLTGFLGIGGGFLIVPALVLFAGLNARMAAGTSLAIITLNSSTGLLGQLRFVGIQWNLLAGFLAFAISGMVIGSSLNSRLAEHVLRRVFATTILVLGLAVGIGNLFLT